MRGLRVFGHPLHAVLSDVPVGLLGTSLLWDAVGLWRGEPLWWALSFWGIALGLATAAAAATAGFIDYAAIEPEDPAPATGTRHMMFVICALVPYGISLAVRGGSAPPSSGRLIAVLSLDVIGLLLLSIGGWYGGHLVFHHGVGSATKEVRRTQESRVIQR